jgi:hypothetical protein
MMNRFMGILWTTSEEEAQEYLKRSEERYRERVERGETNRPFAPPSIRIVPFRTIKYNNTRNNQTVDYTFRVDHPHNRRERRAQLKEARRRDTMFGEQKSNMESRTKKMRDHKRERKLERMRKRR